MNNTTLECKKYREDPHLEFLAHCSEKELQFLAHILTYGAKGKKRMFNTIVADKHFRQLADDPEKHKKCWQLIAAELQLLGGDSMVNTIRRKGVLYEKILRGICKRYKVPSTPDTDVLTLESLLLQSLLSAAFDKMTKKQQADFLKSVGADAALRGKPAKTVISALIGSGCCLAPLLVSIITQTSIRAATTSLATQGVGQLGVRMAIPTTIAGPIGMAIGSLLMLSVFTGPAYRVLVPAVLYIAEIRQSHLSTSKF